MLLLLLLLPLPLPQGASSVLSRNAWNLTKRTRSIRNGSATDNQNSASLTGFRHPPERLSASAYPAQCQSYDQI